MSEENNDKDWIIELCVRPHQMSPIDPPLINNDNENYSRILYSIYGITLAESLLSHKIDSYILEHIQLEKECSEQDDLDIVWSDDVSLTLCFLASLAYQGKYLPEHLFNTYSHWWMNGYMCPTGHCFTPHANLKRSFELFDMKQNCEYVGIELDPEKEFLSFVPPPSTFLQISPIAYFYSKHSLSKRIEIIKDYIERMFGKQQSIDIFINYIELLVNAINGLSKDKLIKSIQFQFNSNNLLDKIFLNLIDLLLNDKNNIEQGIQLILEKKFHQNIEQCKYLNPYDSNQTIILTLYLQLSAAIYNYFPENFLKNLYGKKQIDCLIKWIIYQRNQNLHLI